MPIATPEIIIAEDIHALSRKAAEVIMAQVLACLNASDCVTMVLSGGSTPRHLFTLLATDSAFEKQIPWHKIHFFWADERHVPPNHPDSNYRLAFETMLSKLPVPPANIHRIRTEAADVTQAADMYAHEIAEFFRLAAGQIPRFDCILLGMGADGHTASLFPETAALHQKKRLVVANWVKKIHAYRITLTVPVVNNAGFILFLISGAEKAPIFKQIIEGAPGVKRFPVQLIQPVHGKCVWVVDRAAAKNLDVKQ